eukprot:923730-Lingulodinium_polyedra.AAC.1
MVHSLCRADGGGLRRALPRGLARLRGDGRSPGRRKVTRWEKMALGAVADGASRRPAGVFADRTSTLTLHP